MKYLHPILFAIYPIFYLYSENTSKLALNFLVLPLGAVICGALIIQILFLLISRSLSSAALFASSVVIGCTLFRDGSALLSKWGIDSISQQVMLGVLVLMWIIIGFLLFRFRKLPVLNAFLSIVACALLIMTVGQTAPKLFQMNSAPPIFAGVELLELPASKIRREMKHVRPDIFYIVLDAFGRDDILKEIYGLDSTEFIAGLEGRGFYVARKSRSNYCQTSLSLASTLNINYLDSMAKQLRSPPQVERFALNEVLNNNQLMRFLSQIGYRVQVYTAGFSGAQFTRIHQEFAPFLVLSEFTQLVVTRSIFPTLFNFIQAKFLHDAQFESHRKRVRYTLQHLGEKDIANTRQPRFVLAHILSPHPPFLFDSEGNSLTPVGDYVLADGSHYRGAPEEYKSGYRGQVSYIQREILVTIDRIIANYPNSVIIVQGDHGPGLHLDWESFERSDVQERLSILNAYRVSDELKAKLYPTITPVNTFRMILNAYFKLNLPILNDRSFYSEWYKPFKFFELPAE
jgi:hypothetical protein